MYLATPEGFSLNEREKELRRFEKVHAHLLGGQKRLSRLGFYDSRVNRNLYGDAEARSLLGLRTWMQACYRRNVPFDLFQQEELNRLGEYDVVVLNEVAFLSDEELATFRNFVMNGGTLLWTGRTGTRSERRVPRSSDVLAQQWELKGSVCVEDGDAMLIHPIGKGKLVTVAGDFGLGPIEPEHNADRWQREEVRVPFQAVSEEE
ncbi:MAG: beta-galactosidase trimerization domain-containing protein, partial [Candidatus Latescibacteria bacterium]|nr:beta-galactosidase trimerization domain-containing protein [Candidatus Latescibacterota bacterium]